ncbi:hypothetical protein [Streptomyces rubellomurinus]|uniref:Uncharacterized protein n=1 Tax=Streptomyces sp. Y1 TaxID=3238634 RepID=A0AB39TTG3_9ACTN|nr:hypothetical protein VM98_17070 [Streptomyces rubellomurinus subsp. indigoferus]
MRPVDEDELPYAALCVVRVEPQAPGRFLITVTSSTDLRRPSAESRTRAADAGTVLALVADFLRGCRVTSGRSGQI